MATVKDRMLHEVSAAEFNFYRKWQRWPTREELADWKAGRDLGARPRRSQPERDLQMACTQWRDLMIASGRLRDKCLVHIPAERKDKLDAIQMKRCGAVAGVPDWLCLRPRDTYFVDHTGKRYPLSARCAFIELKAPKGSLSKEQREFRDLCLDLGIPYSIARSLEEFQRIVSDYGMLKEGKR